MASNLMAPSVHVLDNTTPVLVDGALANVVAGDEKGCLASVLLEHIHDLRGVDVWAIVIGNSDSLWLQAGTDADATVLNVA